MNTAMQKCEFDDGVDRCTRTATEHLATMPGFNRPGEGSTMACADHCTWFDDRRDMIRDHHPITVDCGMPGTSWIDSSPVHGPGLCFVDSADFNGPS